MKLLIENESEDTPLDLLCLDHPISRSSDYEGLFVPSSKSTSLNWDILVTTTHNLIYLLNNNVFNSLKPKLNISNLIVDKVDLHLALDLEEELKQAGNLLQNYCDFESGCLSETKIVITTNEQEKVDGFDEIKTAFMKDRKAVIIKLKEQAKSTSLFESVGHLVVEWDQDVQKYLIFYTLVKFNVLKGRTLLFVDTLYEAYKVKIFWEKFYIRWAIMNPESTKINRKSAFRYFHAGQYDILILIRMKYSYKLRTNGIVNVVNFTTPQNIQDYTKAANKLDFENGSVLTLTYSEKSNVHENKEDKYLLNIIKKMKKRYGRSLLVTLPIDWLEVNKLKSRIDDIHCTLTNKKVKTYMSNEIKKQILSSKKLKEYFNEHGEEKEILKSSIESDYSYRYMHKNLDYLPNYLYPKSIIKSQIEMEIDGVDNKQNSSSIQGLTSDLLFVQNLNNIPRPKETFKSLPYEDPSNIDPERLQYTSGRKLWKLKHKKRIQKKIRKGKDGYSH